VLGLSINAKVIIVVPEPDLAANTIWNTLQSHSYFKESAATFDNNPVYELVSNPNDIKLVHSRKDGVESNHLDQTLDSELYVFASRHRAASGTPALLIHPTGNWSKITLGGKENELSYTSAWALKEGLLELKENKEKYNLDEFKVDLEVTHHGPTNLATPLIYMELGSSEEYWKNEEAALAVGESIINTAKKFIRKSDFKEDCFVGFGGNHYAYRFHKHIMENEKAYVSHMAAKHSLDSLTKERILEAFKKTLEKPNIALIDKKGATSPQRRRIMEILDEIEKEYILV
jgi:D-aminoacyl-tRNA deacylase